MLIEESRPINSMLARYAGYGPMARARKAVMVLQAYIDDSTQHRDGKRVRYFLAGYVNYVSNWVAFSENWEKELLKLPAIKSCHMRDAEVRRKEFAGLGVEQVEKKVLDLSNVIARSEPWSFDVSVDIAEYEQLFDFGVPHIWKSPTFVAFLQVLRLLPQLHSVHKIELPVDIIFDSTEAMVRPFNAFYQSLRASLPVEIGKLLGQQPQFLPSHNIVALQAADMLAWHVQKETVDGLLSPKRAASQNLFAPNRHISIRLDGEYLGNIAGKIKSLNYEDRFTTKAFWVKMLGGLESGEVRLKGDEE